MKHLRRYLPALISIAMILGALFLPLPSTFAQTPPTTAQDNAPKKDTTTQNNANKFQLFPGESEGLKNRTDIPEIVESADYRIYLNNLYRFSIAAALLVATVLIMIGGIIWVTSAGNQGRITKAKSYIIDSIIGVIILLSSVAFLQFINPALVNLQPLEIPDLGTFGACIFDNEKGEKTCLLKLEKQCNEIRGGKNKNGIPEFFKEQTCNARCERIGPNNTCTPKPTFNDAKLNEKSKQQLIAQRCELMNAAVVNSLAQKAIDTFKLTDAKERCEAECTKLKCNPSRRQTLKEGVNSSGDTIAFCGCTTKASEICERLKNFTIDGKNFEGSFGAQCDEECEEVSNDLCGFESVTDIDTEKTTAKCNCKAK